MSDESFERGRRYERELAQHNIGNPDKTTNDYLAGYNKGIQFGQNWIIYLLSLRKDDWLRITQDAIDEKDWDAVAWASAHASKLDYYIQDLKKQLEESHE